MPTLRNNRSIKRYTDRTDLHEKLDSSSRIDLPSDLSLTLLSMIDLVVYSTIRF